MLNSKFRYFSLRRSPDLKPRIRAVRISLSDLRSDSVLKGIHRFRQHLDHGLFEHSMMTTGVLPPPE